MSRRRYISTDISTDPKVAELAQYGTLPVLLYTWAIPHLDDWGRMIGDARQFQLLVCPALDIKTNDVEEALNQISSVGLWERYQVDGRYFIAVHKKSFYTYQTYIGKEKRTADKSQFPAPLSQETPQNAEEQQQTQQITVIPSPSPTPSPILDDDDDNSARENFVTIFEQATGRFLNPFEMEKLDAYITQDGMEEAVVCFAIKRARERDACNIAYIEATLRSWHSNGVKTLKAAELACKAFDKQKDKHKSKVRHIRAPVETIKKKTKYDDLYMS